MVATDQTHPSGATNAGADVFGAPRRRPAVRRQLHYALCAATGAFGRLALTTVILFGPAQPAKAGTMHPTEGGPRWQW